MKLRICSALLAAVMLISVFPVTAVSTSEEAMAATTTQKSDKETSTLYKHDIDMDFLSDYIYGGSKATSGKRYPNVYTQVQDEWYRHYRPSSLKYQGKVVIYGADIISASFYPGTPPINYHAKRLEELKEIGYYPETGRLNADASNANIAFYAYKGSTFELVAYNDEWVAVWTEGGVDESRGLGNPCGGAQKAPYASYKPGVYFFKRANCLIQDVDNQVSKVPKFTATGTLTSGLYVYAKLGEKKYIRAGAMYTDATFPVLDTTPVDGFYKIYFGEAKGIYYISTKYVNVKLADAKKPTIQYKATVTGNDINIRAQTSINSDLIGAVRKGATVEVIKKDYNSSYSQIWFNSKKCFIQTQYLGSFSKVEASSNAAKLGKPIGVVVVDAPYRAYGQKVLTKEGLEIVKKNNYLADRNVIPQLQKISGYTVMKENEWANVYKIKTVKFNVKYRTAAGKQDVRKETAKIYTVLYNGKIGYIAAVPKYDSGYAFTYYAGSTFKHVTTARTQIVNVDGTKYYALAYDINKESYFKIKDIAKMLANTSKPLGVKINKSTGEISLDTMAKTTGTISKSDGKKRTAYPSDAYLTCEGSVIDALVYRINGEDYVRLSDIGHFLNCKNFYSNASKSYFVYTFEREKSDVEG